MSGARTGEDWAALGEQILGCTACPELVASRRAVVVGAAPPGARLLVVGEAPGAAEDECGQPFVGRSGQLLDRLLGEVGLDRAAVAVVNVLKCRPPGNRRPRALETQRCQSWLTRQLASVDPDVVCLLGSSAVEAFFGCTARIGPLRGRVHEVDGRAMVATYHPSAAIRFGPNGAPLAALRADLALVARELQ